MLANCNTGYTLTKCSYDRSYWIAEPSNSELFFGSTCRVLEGFLTGFVQIHKVWVTAIKHVVARQLAIELVSANAGPAAPDPAND